MKAGEEAAVEAIATLFTARTGVEIRSNRFEIVKGRLAPRLRRLGISNYEDYSEYLSQNFQEEIVHVVAQLTTHRTEFFREIEQINHFVKEVVEPAIKARRSLRIWSAAASTGEEPYSLAMAIAESLTKQGVDPENYGPGFEIFATDIDAKSLAVARNGVYESRLLESSNPTALKKWLQKGSGDLSRYHRVRDSLHRKCSFKIHNLLTDDPPSKDFDAVFCRNVFIYFTKTNRERALQGLVKSLRPGGLLFLGCTEPLEKVPAHFESVFQSSYRLKSDSEAKGNKATVGSTFSGAQASLSSADNFQASTSHARARSGALIRVLIVDDSRTVRLALRQALERNGRFEVVADVEGTSAARKILASQQIDVMTLDINMPEESGLAYLEKENASGAMANHPPVVIVSSINPDDADVFFKSEQLGATAYIEKPANLSSKQVAFALAETLASAAGVSLHSEKPKLRSLPGGESPLSETQQNQKTNAKPFQTTVSASLAKLSEAILIGSSTGGTVAIAEIFKTFPADFPPVVVAQHIPGAFISTLIKNLNELTGKRVVVGEDNQKLERQTIYILPGHAHGVVVKKLHLTLELQNGPPVNGHTPSVDVLFSSAAKLGNCRSVVALLLTGMGADGAKGLLALRQAGAVTICQDEKSSVVFGMPRAGIECGAADYVLPLNRMTRSLFHVA